MLFSPLLLFVRSLLWSYICFIASRPTCNCKILRLCKCCRCYSFCLHWWRFAMAFLLELYGQTYLGGAVLELASKRNLGAYYAHGLCCSSAFLLFKASACASLRSHLHAFGLLNCTNDLLWSELFSWRNA